MKWPWTKEEPEIEEEELDNFEDLLPKASVIFSISQDNVVDIDFEWDGNKKTAELLGELLYNLNEGNMKGILVSLLSQKSAEDEESFAFIKELMNSWQSYIKKTHKMPMVDPLKTFGASRIQL